MARTQPSLQSALESIGCLAASAVTGLKSLADGVEVHHKFVPVIAVILHADLALPSILAISDEPASEIEL